MTTALHFKICSGCHVEEELEGQDWKQKDQLVDSCNHETMVVQIRKLVLEVERNGHFLRQ